MTRSRQALIGILAATLLPLAVLQAATAATPFFAGEAVAINAGTPDRKVFVYTWSPDGQYMVYQSSLVADNRERELWLVELPDGEPRRISDPAAPGGFGTTQVYFTPDSATIVYSAHYAGASNWYSVPTAGGAPVQLAVASTSFVPTLSEDSQYIVTPDPTTITSAPVDGGPSVVLATGTSGSRSGANRMLYRQSGVLYSIDYTGGTPTQLSAPGQGVHLYFDADLPTATVSYFATNPGETGYSLYQVPEVGGTPVRIAGPGIDNVQPAGGNIEPFHQSSKGWAYTTIVGGVTSLSTYDPLTLTLGELVLPPGAASSFRQGVLFSQNNEYAVIVTDTALIGTRVDGTVSTVFTTSADTSRVAVSNDGQVAFVDPINVPNGAQRTIYIGQVGTPGITPVYTGTKYFGRFSRDSQTMGLFAPNNDAAILDLATGDVVELDVESRVQFSYDSRYAFYALDDGPNILRSILRDIDTPIVATNPDVVANATSAAGAVVNYSAPLASDPSDPAPVNVECLPASGSTFALGNTTVTCAASDTSGNMAMSTFVVTVEDNGSPTISAVGDITAEATGPTGASVAFTPPTATDAVDPSVGVSCDSSSGDVFPLGPTLVTCTATDASGNSDSTTFDVTVVDTTNPTIDSVADVTAEADGPAGSVVTFVVPGASDSVDQSVAVSCDALSGDLFALGATAVTCTATDASGNSDSTTFDVTVADTTGPTVSVPAQIVVDATDVDGAVVTFAASAVDSVDGTLVPTCSPASGDLFAVGTTMVTCDAQDAAGNLGSESFDVTVNPVGLPGIIDQLADAADSAPPGAAQNLNKAIDRINNALAELDETPPDVDKAIDRLAQATREINKAVADGFSAAEAAALNAAIADIALGLAQAEIDAAIARGGDQNDIDSALDHLADGLAELADSDWENAIKDFADAAKDAMTA